MPSPSATNSPQMSQNLITMVVSAQPSSSKWCCSGAIRNTRRPVILNDPTWMITDSAITTNSPPSMASSSWVLVHTARPRQPPAEGERAGVAHEDAGRGRVPPQEPEARAEHGGGDHREVERVADG